MAGGEDVFSLSGEEDLSEQEDDGYYFDSDNGNSDDDSLGYGEAESEDDEESLSRKVQYVVLTPELVKEKQQAATHDVVSVLSVSPGDARALLRHFNWNVGRLQEDWFQDESTIRTEVGIKERSTGHASGPSTDQCGICFESYSAGEMFSESCGHSFCRSCWKGYFKSAAMDGPSALTLRCPFPKCTNLVCEEHWEAMASPDTLGRYREFEMRSYVEQNRRVKWCPAPGCQFAVECAAAESTPTDVTCRCGNSFCWSCMEEAHRPVDCDTVRKWNVKNSAESGNVSWILANSKPCPQCKRPIEKNQGCMHMTCTQCKYEFCWLCLGDWKEHGGNTGGYYSCNRYEAARKRGEYDELEKRRDMAKSSLERFMHFCERWAEHNKSQKEAKKNLTEFKENMQALSSQLAQPTSQLNFVVDAIKQVAECRRILKWTYAYGYYLSEDTPPSTRSFFEFLQGEAEHSLERLNDQTEQELKPFLVTELTTASEASFNEFRSKLIGLTDVTKNYFDKLVRELEQDLGQIGVKYTDSSPPTRG
mmetsp:Transcript_896/g.3259  ORF Transcript_896/g.3259 Transcript_896/m.3259 type:complete len:534 (-) Transcript_896:162-1763(-)